MTLFATATELKNNFGLYSKHVENGDNVYITKNGKPFGIFRQLDENETPLSEALIGGVKGRYDYQKEKDDYINEKYGYIR